MKSLLNLTPAQKAWLEKQAQKNPAAQEIMRERSDMGYAERTSYKDENPCIKVYGFGPDETHCFTCTQLVKHKPPKSETEYYKCKARGITDSSVTNHKAGWPSCKRYEANQELVAKEAVLAIPKKYRELVDAWNDGSKTLEALKAAGFKPRGLKRMFDTAMSKGLLK